MDRSTKEGESAYISAHMWMRYHHGKPQLCEHCGTTEKRMYHWANLSRTYIRDRSDWIRLCVPCHKKHDIQELGGSIKARPRIQQPSKRCPVCRKLFFKNPHISKTQWDSQTICSKACNGIHTGKLRLGISQSAETKALKSQRLRERWTDNKEWRDRMTTLMQGNQYARKNIN